MKLFYTISKTSYTSVIVVLDKEGVVYYAALGDNLLVLTKTMQADFAKIKKLGIVAPSLFTEGLNEKISNTNKLFCDVIENPTLINTANAEQTIPHKFIFGTPLQQKVWTYLLDETTHGKYSTYSEIATALLIPTSSRVVANACGANKIAILVPCHRVLTKDGKISGYRWGVAKKKILLDRENQKGSKENNTWKLDLLEVKFFNTKPRFPRTKLLLKSKKLKFNLPESRDAALEQVNTLKRELCERKVHASKTKLERALKKYAKVEGGKATLQLSKIIDNTSKRYTEALVAVTTIQGLQLGYVANAKLVKLCEKVYLTSKELKLYPPLFIPEWIKEAILDKSNPSNPSFQFKNNSNEVNNMVSKIFNTKEFKDLLANAESNMKLVLGPVDKPVTEEATADSDSSSDSDSESDDESVSEISKGEDTVSRQKEVEGDEEFDSDSSIDYDVYKDMVAASSDEDELVVLNEDIDYNDVTDQEPSDEEENSEDSEVPEKKIKDKKKKEVFPELASGYFSGDSGSDISDDEMVKNITKPRKNRRGQRARQKIWEQKYGAKATHVQKEQERYKSERETKQKEYEARVAKRALLAAPSGTNDIPLGDRGAIQAAALKRKAQEDAPLHPSWEAKKKQKEMTQAKFSGKKVTFD
ncbi:hypothetical protein BABINDRAFT_15761 [Babjeviella inositovora NRRL Y-12698]|uniref:Methylated-DNA--protein-cysteine methyltransferase n=1 Tax=Babjeviella inositovora NRRL Y-12698 TaxID=984486 RepID=A0A1E3QH61_9ASCO|nr:uncharacterized protein BABINDRAFT_15761 [Babjeviella inositovora NRRL Y-12698]ODQ77053.1 hypothetical protein BABINDRAFT_15761 [Babjeviella inositovora NRRL Y-12698]